MAGRTTDQPPRRLLFVDLLRLLAIFQMLQGHSIDAVLDEELRSGAWHALWTAARGLTSVAFLFVAGFAAGWGLLGNYDAQRRDVARARTRTRRAVGLVVLGYALHLPVAALAEGNMADALATGTVVDILQCIGVSLLLLELAVRCCSSPRALLGGAATAGLVALAGAELAWSQAGRLPLGLAGYVGPVNGALFPLWPWSAHLWIGVVVGGVLRGAPRQLAQKLALIALSLALVGFAVAGLGLGTVAADHLQRLAWVVAAGAAFDYAARGLPGLPPVPQTVSSSSLRIYVVHVLVLYADGVGLSSRPGPTLSLPWALFVAGMIIAGSVGVALVRWPRRWVVARVPGTS